MACPFCERLADPRDPDRIAELGEGVVFLGENQGCPGWCVLVLKQHVEHLADLEIDRQARIFAEVARVASAVRAAIGQAGRQARQASPIRINYECLGNVVAHVHWHIIPRHHDDPTPRATVWGWSPDRLRGSLEPGGRSLLIRQIRDHLPGG